jgi:sigma-B regulation protein RsbU (phosphoserine phosphatase)
MFHAVEAANNGLQEANNKLQTVNQDLRTAQDKINKDLEHAQTIQQGLLPQKIPNTPALSLQASYIPATAVGGDYYDAFEITPGIYGIIVADVSGHGVSSALIMSMVKVLIKSITTIDSGPQKTLEKINEIFQTEIRTTNFVTVFYAILDTNSHELHYTSAGHCPVLFINKKERTCSLVKADGLFLGVFPDMMLHETSVPYEPGTQRLVLYTDGLTEARNNQNVMYELDRLIGISLKSLDDSADKACSRILTHQKKFCGKNAIPEDDITLLVVDF